MESTYKLDTSSSSRPTFLRTLQQLLLMHLKELNTTRCLAGRSAVITELVMEDIEEKALTSALVKPHWWRR